MAVTYKQVTASAERLLAAGRRVSLSAIRAELGSGSMTTLTPLLKRWREEHLDQETEGAEQQVPTAVISTITQAVEQAIREAVQETTATLTAELAAKETDLAAYAAEGQERETLLASVCAERDTLSSEVARLKGALEESQRQTVAIQAQLDSVTADLTSARSAMEAMQARVADADTVFAQADKAAEQIQALENRVRELETESTLLKQDASDLRALREKLPALQSAADRYEELAARYDSLAAQSQKELRNLQDLVDAQRIQTSKSLEQLAAAKSDEAAAKGRAEAAAELIAELKQDKKALTHQLAELRASRARELANSSENKSGDQ